MHAWIRTLNDWVCVGAVSAGSFSTAGGITSASLSASGAVTAGSFSTTGGVTTATLSASGLLLALVSIVDISARFQAPCLLAASQQRAA